MDVPASDAPNIVKTHVPIQMQTIMASSHQRSTYKRFGFDFYKPEGFSELEKVQIKDEKKAPKKGTIGWLMLCIGDSVEVEYQIKQESIEYKCSRKLESGDALFIDQTVREFSIGCSKVFPKTVPKSLVCREGSLLVRFERDWSLILINFEI